MPHNSLPTINILYKHIILPNNLCHTCDIPDTIPHALGEFTNAKKMGKPSPTQNHPYYNTFYYLAP